MNGREEGVGLVELLVAIFLMAIVGSVVVSGLVAGYRAQVFAQDRVDALTELQKTVQNIARDMRVADSRDVSRGPFRRAASTQIVFDVYRDGQRTELTLTVSGPDADGEYRIDEARRVWNLPVDMSTNPAPATTSTRPLALGLAAPTTPVFTFFDATGAAMPLSSGAVAAADLPRLAEVRMVVAAVTQAGDPPITVETTVTLRNVPANP